MASNLKVDIVRPTATNGSLSLKGDSGGSATTNGITVNSSGNTSITGTTTVSSLVATTADINGGTIDDTAIGGTTPAAGSFTQVNADNIRLDANTISSTDTDGNINLSPNGNGSAVVTSGGTGDALRITQTGSGNALVVEDDNGNPDSTPFVVGNTGNVGIGTDSLDENFKLKVLSNTGKNFVLSNIETDNSDKAGRICISPYSNTNSPFQIIGGTSVASNDVVQIGGGGSAAAPASTISLYTSATLGTAGAGTERMRIDSSGNVRADKFTNLAGTGAPEFTQGAIFSGSVSGIGQLVGIMHKDSAGGNTNYVTLENNKIYDVVYHTRYTAGAYEVTEYATCSVNGSGVVTITEVVELSDIIIELEKTTNAIRFSQAAINAEAAIGFVFERGTTFDNA